MSRILSAVLGLTSRSTKYRTADGGELQDPQGEPEEAAEDAEEDVERDERQRGEDRETENAPKHGRFPPWCPTVGPYGAI